MTREELELFIQMNIPIAVRNKNGKYVSPYISAAAKELVIRKLTDALLKTYKKPESDLFYTPIKYSSKMKEWPIMNVIKPESDEK